MNADRARAIQPLLFEHPEGLTLEDVADEIGVPSEEADALLDRELRAGAATVDCDASGALVYRSTRRRRPRRSVDQVLRHADAREVERAALAHRLRLRWAAIAGVLAIALVLGVLASRRAQAPAPALAPTSPAAPRVEDRAEAARAAARRRQWQQELEALLGVQRALAAEVDACTGAWSAGHACYAAGRTWTSAAHGTERARVALRVSELRELLAP